MLCRICKKPLETRHQIKYCSVSCAAKHNNNRKNTGKKKSCLWCNKNLINTANTYCNRKCHNEKRRKESLKQTLEKAKLGLKITNLSLIRKHLLTKAKYKCSICGWSKINKTSKTIPLELDHIDGNAKNNILNNLRIICPNCHSLTPNYRALNYGRGRKTIGV